MEGSPLPPFSNTAPGGREESRLLAALGWVWVLSVVVLLTTKGDAFVQFHARQGFALFIASLIGWVLLAVVLPGVWFLLLLLAGGVFAIILVGFVRALRGEWWTLPVLGPLAQRVRL